MSGSGTLVGVSGRPRRGNGPITTSGIKVGGVAVISEAGGGAAVISEAGGGAAVIPEAGCEATGPEYVPEYGTGARGIVCGPGGVIGGGKAKLPNILDGGGGGRGGRGGGLGSM